MGHLKEKLFSPELVLRYRVSVGDFTRKRKQNFHHTIVFMLNFLTKSLSAEIVSFVSFIRQTIEDKQQFFTKSAFVQCRKKIHPEVFKYLSDSLIEEFYTDNDASVKRWNGFRILAVDGSRLTLPDTRELEKIYGRAGNHTDAGVVQARFSTLYDVLNRFVIDGCLSSLSVGERELAYGHLAFAKVGDLIIYDRGYPSFELVCEHFARGVDFLIRVKTDFSNVVNDFYQSRLSTAVVRIRPGKNINFSGKPYSKSDSVQVRLLRVELSSGETEILMSSLFDTDKYPDSLFKELYFLRWGIETFYDEIKNKMHIECFSGYSAHSILQDFYATLFVSNVQSLLVGELNDELIKESKNNKYQYKVNTNLSYGILKDRVITLFLSDKEIRHIIEELKELFQIDKVPIRPNRKNQRNVRKYSKREKPKCFKNKKNAI